MLCVEANILPHLAAWSIPFFRPPAPRSCQNPRLERHFVTKSMILALKHRSSDQNNSLKSTHYRFFGFTILDLHPWITSTIIQPILEDKFFVRNRITWEREKGRGAKSNWKNNTEDVWFCTKSERYHFDADAVKMKRRVLAPYRIMGKPKDWNQEETGNYRLTYPSNIWTDLTIPFWSMPENTDHPTQKPEKLIAKLILASSEREDFVFDPFLGSGTTAVVAEKLGRRWSGVEINEEYLCWALKRVSAARDNPKIQGYEDGVFWERNSNFERRKETGKFSGGGADQANLF